MFLIAPTQLLCKALAAIVDNDCVGRVPNLPAGSECAFAKIDFLKPNKKVFVEHTDFINYFAAHQEKRTGDLLNLVFKFIIKISRVITRYAGNVRKDFGDFEQHPKNWPEGRKTADAGLERAIAVQMFAADDSGLRFGAQGVERIGQCPGLKLSVGVQEQ